jgi:hypothetical protein
MIKYLFKSLAVGVFLILSGCYPNGSRTLENTELVYTNYDENFDFSMNRTYFLVNEVRSIDTNSTIPDQTQQYILAAIRNEMAKKNYTETTSVDENGYPTGNPGVIILSSAVVVTTQGINYWPSYGCWWGWCYGWGGVAIPYQYDSGILNIDHIDGSTFDPDSGVANLIWISNMSGVLNSSGTSQNRIDRVISQAYEQSPYM